MTRLQNRFGTEINVQTGEVTTVELPDIEVVEESEPESTETTTE
jgi:hypothetical protein